MSTKPIILKAGHALPGLRARFDDYEHWFARAAGRPLSAFHVIEARGCDFDLDGARSPDSYAPVEFPDPRSVDGVIITGSASTVHEREAWSVRAGEWCRRVAEAGIPVLGVCYGHQLMADTYGGKVHRNPNGREIGVLPVRLTEAGRNDPLFDGCDDELWVSLTHNDAVNEAPPGTTLLATNTQTPVQALSYGDNLRTVQFHPEFEVEMLAALIDELRPAIDRERGAGATAELLASLRREHQGRRALRNFLEHWLGL